MKIDMLKYWRVVRRHYKAKYNLSQSDLEMLLFLYSEGKFTSDKFTEYTMLMSWDNERFKRLKRDGWIETFRKRAGRFKALYQLTYKAKRMIYRMYEILNGDNLPMHGENNPLIRERLSYTDNRYKNFMIKMNEEIPKGQR